MTFSHRALLPFLLFVPIAIFAQPRAQPCFFLEDFEGDGIPAGWDIGPWVERLSEDGEPLEEWVLAWTIGNAAEANAGGFFPVPDLPVGNRFIMANDDAFPCPCDLSEVTLTTPPLDLTDRSNVVLEFRTYHDMGFGGGDAFVEASPDGNDWYVLHTIPALAGEWQRRSVDMTAWSGGENVRIRFRWSDNGQWATGFAIDDVCLRERVAHDLSLLHVTTGNDTVSPFTTGDQSLRYTMLPLEQSGPFWITAVIMNRGTDVMTDISIGAMIQLDGTDHGPFNSDPIGMLHPGEERTVLIATDWTPSTTGELVVTATVNAAEADEDPTDNSATTTMRITGPGWDDGYSAMALDEGEVQGAIGSSGNFIAGNRFELVSAGTPYGITAVIGAGTEAGAEVRAVLFDAQLAVIDTSARYQLAIHDVVNGIGGGGIYLPFANPVQRPAGDLFAGLQRTGAGPLFVALSGNSIIGSSVIMQGNEFVLDYPEVTPMVRLHLSALEVGVNDRAAIATGLTIIPNPAVETAWVNIDMMGSTEMEITILDGMGRMVHQRTEVSSSIGARRIAIDTSDLAAGIHLVRVVMNSEVHTGRLVVAGR